MYLSSRLCLCRMRRTSCTMDGFCLLYLLMILLMRSGDVETNPGPDRIVSEKELLTLSKQIEPSYYKVVGINLDISIAELRQIEKDSQSTSDALMTVFTRWRDKQPHGTDIRALLAEELERCDLGSLSGELLTGTLVPTRTGAPATMPGSETQSLSPDLIKRCADDLKFKYRTTLCKIRADPLDPDSIVPFKDMYTNLVLEEEYQKNKRPLEYRDLFDLKANGEFPKRIMVQGEAGAGKTTFCSKIAWDWINDSPVLPKFVWVLVVPLREAKQYTIGEIAKSYLSKDNPATACQITEYIRSNPKDIFIAFDGLDESHGEVVQQTKAGLESECHQPKSADQTKARSKSKMKKNNRPNLLSPTSTTSQPRVYSAEASRSCPEIGKIALRDILCSDELAACPVLVTSRPWKVAEIRLDDRLSKQYTFLHIEGFSKENVEVYIHKYFQDDRVTADQLIQLTKDNVIISENMAPYPIYIAMLCLMWRELGDEKLEKLKSFQTFSQIFDEMFEFLKVHYAQKEVTDLGSPSFKDCLSEIEKLMEPVFKVAFIGLQENTLIFKEDDLEQCSNSIETACRVGVLSQEKKLSSMNDKSSMFLQSTIFFPHKLFQEYMAGVHLASLYELDHNEFNRLIEQVVLPRKEEFRYLLYFTVSQDKAIAHHVINSMLQGNTTNQEEMDFLVDVSLESQDLETAALVRGRTSSLTINHITTAHTMTAHTIAGYLFTGLGVHKDWVRTLTLTDVTCRCPTSASSHHLAEALCSMANLAELRLQEIDFQEEFYSTLNAKASTLQLAYGSCRPPESRDTCTYGGRRGSGDVETNPGQNRIVSVLSEKELLTLSKKIEPSYYKEVGINLDISIAELGQIKEHSQNTSDALLTVFKRWRDKQPTGTDIRALLAEKLKRSDLGSLSGELLAGSLVLKGAGITTQSKSNEESSSPVHRSDKTTSYPSSPNTRTSTTTPTTAADTTTISLKAFFVITLLAWVTATVSGTTPEISSTTGDTVNITCLFGEGTLSKIFWSYIGGTGPQKILKLDNGVIFTEPEYENRASLQGDFSTLILKDITLYDEGTYRCDVDRQGLTVVTNITTKLNVFSLRPDTFPVISPCTRVDKSSSCIIHANQPITCTLRNVYPVEDAELIWYQDGQNFPSTHNVTQNEDGTTDISRQIQASETGSFTCNATYLSAFGTENTAVSVEARIIPPADVPNTPGKNRALISGLTPSMLILLVAAIIFFSWAKGQRYFRRESNEPQLDDEAESCKLSKQPAVTCTNCEEVHC